QGTERYLPHSAIDLVPIDGRKRWSSGDVPTDEQFRDAVQTWVLDPAAADLQYRHLLNWLFNVRYLTDRPVDADLLYLLDEGPRAAHRPYLGARVDHTLPFIDGLDTKTILKLRSEEGEAFEVYRDRVRTLVEDTTL